MGTRFVALPDGRWTEAPDNLSDAEVYSAMGFGAAPQQQAKGKNGVLGIDLGDVARGFGSTIRGIASTVQDATTQQMSGLGLAAIPLMGLKYAAPTLHETGQNIENRYPADYNSIKDIHGVGDAVGFIGENLLTQAPNLLVGGAGGALAMGSLTAAQTYGDVRDYQRQHGYDSDADRLAAVGAAIPSGLLDAGLGIGRGLGITGGLKKAGEEGAESLLKRTGKTMFEEGATEVAQQAMQRAAQYQDLNSPEAWEEYATAGLAGAGVGGVFSVATHPSYRRSANNQNPDDLGPLPANEPANLLALPDYSQPAMYVTPQGEVAPDLDTAIRTVNQPHDPSSTPVPQDFQNVPLGTQTDMFNPNPVAASEPATQRADDAGGQKPTQLPDPLQPSLFDEAPDALTRTGFGPREVRLALTGGARPDAFIMKVGTQLTRAFADGNINDARKAIDKEFDRLSKADLQPQTIEHRLQVLDRANNLVETYNSQHLDAQAQAGVARAEPGVNVGPAPSSAASAVAQAKEQNATAKSTTEPALRKQLLERSLTTQDVRDPAAYFEALLKRNNLDPTVTDDEFEHMYKTLEQRDADEAELAARQQNNGVAAIEAEVPSTRKQETAAAFTRAEQERGIPAAEKQARENRRQQLQAKEAAVVAPKEQKFQDDTPQVTKVAPGDARGVNEKSREAHIPVDEKVEEAGELTQTQVDQQETYKRIGEARAANLIDDREQALLTNMIRKGAPAETVRQAVKDLTQQRKRKLRGVNNAEKLGILSPREAAIERAEAKPKKAALPQLTDEEVAALPQSSRHELVKAHMRSALERGSFPEAIAAIAKYHPNPVFRRMATMMKDGLTNVEVSIGKLPNDKWSGVTYISDSHIEIVLDPTIGMTPQTVLHEAIHAFLISRIGMMSLPSADGFIGKLPDPMKDALMNYLEVHDAMKNIFDNLPPEHKTKPWAVESLQDLDEFVAYIPTDNNAQQYLATVGLDGKPLKRGQQSVWAKLIDALRRILRLPPMPQTKMALEEILKAQIGLVNAASKLSPNMDHANAQIAAEEARQAKPMYTGEKSEAEGKSAREANLVGAKTWEKSGMPMQQIKLLTGWWKNPHDGKWRFEITDHTASWNQEVWDELPESKMGGPEYSTTLDKVLNHPTLFNFYPQLRDVKVSKRRAFLDVFGGTQGWFNEKTNELVVTPNAKDQLSTALHEIQHVIQGIEGWARGGNKDMAANLLSQEQLELYAKDLHRKATDDYLNTKREISRVEHVVGSPEGQEYREKMRLQSDLWRNYTANRDKYGEEDGRTTGAKKAWLQADKWERDARSAFMQMMYGTDAFFKLDPKQQDEFVQTKIALGKSREDLRRWREEKELKAEQAETVMEMTSRERVREEPEETRKLLKEEMGHALYENIAGEMEARDVQERQKLTPQERDDEEPLTSQPEDPDKVLVHHGEGFESRSETRIAKPARVDETQDTVIDKPVRAIQAVKDVVNGQGTRFAAIMALGPKLAEMAHNAGVSSAQAYARLIQERGAIAEQAEQKFIDLSERFDSLARTLTRDRTLVGRGKGSINNLAKRSVYNGKWAFEPSWLRDDKGQQIKVEVDPALNAEYKAMPEKARKVFEDGFRLPHEILHQKRKAVTDFLEGEHQVLIDRAQAQYDAAVARGASKDATTELANALRLARKHREEDFKKFNRLFNVRLDEPYMPIRRFGDYVVVGRSAKYLEEELKSRETGDDEKLTAMKSEPEHYFVDFAENNAEAERLRREVARQFGMSNVEKFTKDQSRDQLMGGQDMFHAFERLRSLVATSTNGDARNQLDKMITDLLLSTLVASSSRRAELARLKVAGGQLDMVRGAIAQGRADASFIAGIHKNSDILDTLGKMKDEAQFQNGERDAAGREKRQSLVNEILARHVMSMTPAPQNTLVDKMTAFTALWMLTLSPSFYVQQLTQPAVMSVPISAAKHGYGAAWREMFRGYKRVSESLKGTGITGSLDLNQLPREYIPLATFLAERGRLDVGIAKELGNWTSDGRGMMSDTMHNVVQKFGALTRKSEAINRLATAVMEYNLSVHGEGEIEKLYDPDAYRSYLADHKEMHPDMEAMTERQFAAANHALKLVDDTHGNYDIASAPRFMRGNAARVLTQFKKFQIMQIQLYAQHIKDGFFDKSSSPEEKAVARRSLAFLTAHAAVVAGGLGLPAAEVLKMIAEALMGDDDEPANLERTIRDAVGNPTVADLLLHGIPSLAGINLTNSIGQANILSLAPYADTKTTTPQNARQQYFDYVGQLLGPAVGGIGAGMYQGTALVSDGQYYRGLEKMMPRGISAAMRSYREATQGETTLAGNKTADVGTWETIVSALGLNPIERTRRQFVKDVFYQEQDFYQHRGTEIRRAYAEAETPAEMARVRQQWQQYQLARVKAGLKRQPLSSLMRTEKAQRGALYGQGLNYTRQTRARAERLQGLVEDEE